MRTFTGVFKYFYENKIKVNWIKKIIHDLNLRPMDDNMGLIITGK